jgi:hypothetical protein
MMGVQNLDPQVRDKWHTFKAGRISQQYEQWRKLTSDMLLLRDIKAYAIEFEQMPMQVRPERQLRF